MITDLKDLQHMLKLCRKYGVTEIDFGTTKVKLGDMPKEKDDVDDDVPNDGLTPEQLAFYSAPPMGG